MVYGSGAKMVIKNKLGRIIGIKLRNGKSVCGRVVFEDDELIILDQSTFYHSKLVRVLQSDIQKLVDEV